MRNLINQWNRRPFDKAPILDPAIARALRRRYYDEILTLEEIIGRDLGMWRSEDDTARFPQGIGPDLDKKAPVISETN